MVPNEHRLDALRPCHSAIVIDKCRLTNLLDSLMPIPETGSRSVVVDLEQGDKWEGLNEKHTPFTLAI